jgi:sulfatase modifying factor 1
MMATGNRRLARLVVAIATITGASLQVHGAFTMEMVTVGNPGNANDTTGYGAVNYTYAIAKYEVTIGQYATFLNAVAKSDPYGLYDTDMDFYLSWCNGIRRTGTSGGFVYTPIGPDGVRPNGASSVTNRPISWVDWFDAARFVNWLSNGCPSGPCDTRSTEDGAYSLRGAVGGAATRIVNLINPNTGSAPLFRIPSESEWYKAAYFDPSRNGGSGGYWSYSTRSNTPPGNTIGSAPNQANYRYGDSVYCVDRATTRSNTQNYLTDVGAFSGSPSAYGTYDQGGNVREFCSPNGITSTSIVLRGGNWVFDESSLVSTWRDGNVKTDSHFYGRGFRVAGIIAGPTPTMLSVTSGSQSQSQAGYPLISGSAPVVKTGAGTLILDKANTLTGSTTVQQGTLQLAHPAALASSRVIPLVGGTVAIGQGLRATVGGLAANSGGVVDLGTGIMTVEFGLAVTDLTVAIAKGSFPGAFIESDSISVVSKAASTSSAIGQARRIGWLDNGDGSLTFGFAAPGDTNLDWLVDSLDLADLLGGGKFDTGKPGVWQDGDFNYDALVDVLDVAGFLSTGLFDKGFYNDNQVAVAAVPEPGLTGSAAIGLASLIALAAGRRRAA